MTTLVSVFYLIGSIAYLAGVVLMVVVIWGDIKSNRALLAHPWSKETQEHDQQ